MRPTKFLVLALVIWLLFAFSVAHARKWTSTSGATIEAEFVELADGKVTLKTPDGKLKHVAVQLLSDFDQRYVRERDRARQKSRSALLATDKSQPVKSQEGNQDAKSSSESAGGKAQQIIAEGVGTTADGALKDAFRNAVRQVVGAVLDAETLVKNDELIDDKVLTYSDGFIPKYEEVSGSKKHDGALFRIKIKAQVDRRSVVAKLKSANVTAKDIDGKSMFAEAVTQIDAEKDATALLQKALEGLPSLLTASLVGKPEFDKTKSEVIVKVAIEVDSKAYSAFTERLETILKKVRLAEDSVLLKGTAVKDVPDLFEVVQKPQPPNAKLGTDKANVWCLWLCKSSTGGNQTTRWNCNAVDADLGKCIGTLLVPDEDGSGRDKYVNRHNESKTNIHIHFFDSEGKIVSEDQWELCANRDCTIGGWPRKGDEGPFFPFLRHAVVLDNRYGFTSRVEADVLNDYVGWKTGPVRNLVSASGSS